MTPETADHALRANPLHGLTLAQIAALCRTPYGLENYSPMREHNYLLLDCASAAIPVAHRDVQTVTDVLRQLPCPVVAVGTLTLPALRASVDVIVDTPRAAVPVLKNIDAHPIAAMTLVQLLRHNAAVTSQQGLLAESLAYASLQGASDAVRWLHFAPGQASNAAPTDAPVLVQRRDNTLYVVLNRAQRRNAYCASMRDALYEALLLLRSDSRLQRGVIRGAGSCFSIGGDLHEFGSVPSAATAHAIRSSRNVGQLLLSLGSKLEFQLHRACIGAGIELPAFAAHVVAARNTFMQLPEIQFGLLPGAGGTVSIAKRIGRHRTAYLALSARRINAATALQWGLIDAIV